MVTLNLKLLLQVSIRELNNSLVSDPLDDGFREDIYAENNIIISDSTLRSLLSPKLKKNHQDIKLCVVANVVYLPKIYIRHYHHGVIGIF